MSQKQKSLKCQGDGNDEGTRFACIAFVEFSRLLHLFGCPCCSKSAWVDWWSCCRRFGFYQSEKGKAWFSYLSHAQKEVKQVIWPTRQETVQMTLIVFVVVILMSIFLWLVDMFFLWAVQILTGQGG